MFSRMVLLRFGARGGMFGLWGARRFGAVGDGGRLKSSSSWKPTEGKEVENKQTILNEIDFSLGQQSPPALEYLYVESDFKQMFKNRVFPFYNSGSASNPYGHSALRYTLSDGTSWVANISGAPNSPLLALSPAKDYIFGRSGEQGGIYQRAMRGFRIENVPTKNIEALHNFFLDVQKKEEIGTAKYSLLWGNTLPFINRFSSTEQGNCSYWVSRGLAIAGVLPSPSMWPKFLFISLYFRFFTPQIQQKSSRLSSLFSPDNANIVAYRKQDAPANDPLHDSWISPGFLFSPTGRMFRALERFADVVVATPSPTEKEEEKSTFKSVIEMVSKPFRPFVKKEKKEQK